MNNSILGFVKHDRSSTLAFVNLVLITYPMSKECGCTHGFTYTLYFTNTHFKTVTTITKMYTH